MAEQVYQWGEQQHLLAIWTPPAAPARETVVVMLNAGVIHRIGAHRLYVKLARELSERGYGCLRFDFSGLGDSLVPSNATDFKHQALCDIRLVMDSLSKEKAASRFALLGICSGAAHAQAAAVADQRVAGVFLVDGFMYPSWRGRWHFVRRMALAYGLKGFVQRLVRQCLKLARRQPARALADDRPMTEDDRTPTRSASDFSRDMEQLAGRGVVISLLYTGSVLETFGHAQQLHDVFAPSAWLGHVQCHFEPSVDHTLTLQASQAMLRSRVAQWLDSIRPARAP